MKAKIIDVGMDGCNTMIGGKTGVITRMIEEIPELRSTGACNSHHIANAMKHATNKFNPDIQQALVDVYQDIEGARGKGLKKKKEYEKVARSMGMEHKPKKTMSPQDSEPSSTAFLLFSRSSSPLLSITRHSKSQQTGRSGSKLSSWTELTRPELS